MIQNIKKTNNSLFKKIYQWLIEEKVNINLALILIIISFFAAILTFLSFTNSIPFIQSSPKVVISILTTDLILLLFICFKVVKRIVKLLIARKRGYVGSKISTKYILVFGLLALVPAISVAVFSIFFFNLGMKAWFSEKVQKVVEESTSVANAYLNEHYQNITSDIINMANAIDNQYPWKQSITSMLGFCDQVIVVDGGSTDGTLEELRAWSQTDDRLIVELVERDWSHPRFAVFDGMQKAAARSLCTMQYCWQQDADEVVHENDYEKITRLLTVFPNEVDIVSLPVIEYWGSSKKVRLDVTPWKWRVSRNKPNITHGIPAQFRQTDDDGHLYALPGTDGCDYIDNETHVPMPHASFYSHQAHDARIATLAGNEEAQLAYRTWVENNLKMLPSAYHYSWFDLERKIKTYRDYWSTHWQSLYDIVQEDTSENNMFFDKPWSEVSDADIDSMATKLSTELGGWIFHNKVDFSKKVPHISVHRDHPSTFIAYEKSLQKNK